MSIVDGWNANGKIRMNKGGDLYRRPLNRAEMTAPLEWHERQMAVCYRYGELEDGTMGYEVVGR